MKKILISMLVALFALPVMAQYPDVPDSVVRRSAREQAAWNALHQQAWADAYKIVQQEEKEFGRVYRPWASKPEDLPQAKIPAFPGAEGGGMYTPGGRGGKVFVVTSLEDRGEGTLREACEAGGARIVVFNVAGVIRLKAPIEIDAPYITIAGQTAPGDGICVTGASVHINTHDVVIRHMRFRRGATDVAYRDDALGGNAVGNVMIDHVSASWGLDENMSIYRHVYGREKDGRGQKLPAVNITIQNSIFSECLDMYNHAFGATIGGYNSVFARNVFACNVARNCSIGMNGSFNFVNNTVFNWWNRSVDGGDHTSFMNIINNNYKPGPITPEGKPVSWRIVKVENGRSPEARGKFGRAYVSGNKTWANDEVTADNTKGVEASAPMTDEMRKAIIMEKPFEMAPVTILPTDEAYEFTLTKSGASFPKRDAVDERVMKQVKTGKIFYAKDAKEHQPLYVKRRLPADSYKQGIITNPQQVGGLPEYKGKPYVDTDKDGMHDKWEVKYGLNPNDASDANGDISGDGYTNIEKYINGIDPTVKVDWTNLENNHDTLAGKKKLF
ncbi:MAG: polysaccharide lyase [Rikenellaceae bacterium]|nr:polysaccharide lyase [Rikenellaceae bacterium]